MNKTLGSCALASWLAMSCSGQIENPGNGRAPTDDPTPGSGSSTAGKTAGKGGASPTVVSMPSPGDVKCGTGTPVFGPSPLRRHTNAEYDNTIADLLGDDSKQAASFLPDTRIDNFTNSEAVQNVSTVLAQQYNAAADTIASKAVQGLGLTKLAPCTPTDAAAAESCAKTFITTFGKRAYRRPVTADESAALLKVFKAGMDAGDYASGIKFTLQALLVAPQFLYRLERTDVSKGSARLDSWEIASRLSYLLIGSMPDDLLFQAAEAGKLSTSAEILAQAKRLMDLPRAKDAVRSLFGQWLELDRIDLVEKDTTAYPGYTTELAKAQRTEADLFASEVFWKEDGALAALLTSTYSFRNPALQKFYGDPAITGDFQKVSLDGARRQGVLGLGGFAAHFAKPDASNPVTRGRFVREALLCGEIQPVPPGLNVSLPKGDPKMPTTARERMLEHSQSPVCANCHKDMDPLGLALETLDGAGHYRPIENGKTIDTSGVLTGTDQDGPFADSAALMAKLATSQTVRSCAVRAVFRYAYGRLPTSADACTLQTLEAGFAAGGAKLKSLLLDVAASDAFATRSAPGGTP